MSDFTIMSGSWYYFYMAHNIIMNNLTSSLYMAHNIVMNDLTILLELARSYFCNWLIIPLLEECSTWIKGGPEGERQQHWWTVLSIQSQMSLITDNWHFITIGTNQSSLNAWKLQKNIKWIPVR